jgi:hypothetical protein
MKRIRKIYCVALVLTGIMVWAIGAYAGDVEVQLPSTNGNDAFQVQDSGSNVLMEVQSNGRVGIGTTDPQRHLHIKGNNPRIEIEGAPGNPEVNFETTNTYHPNGWAIYRDYTTGDLRFWNSGADRVCFKYYDGTFYKIIMDGTLLLKSRTSWFPQVGHAGIFAFGDELYALDGSTNSTKLSSHDSKTGEWIFYSKNMKTGRVVRVDMERMVHKIEELTGEKFLIEKWEKPGELSVDTDKDSILKEASVKTVSAR